tara:strand:- start:276 stop:530 length:255 start_codon:yes stop_codon:yes gene_type:complete
MKTKHLAMENGDLTGSSIGDQMSAMAEEGWLEYELKVSIKAYMLSNDFRNGCSFAKKIEVMALKIWTEELQAKSKRSNANGLPF